MNDKEHSVKTAEIDVDRQRIAVADAKVRMEEGYKKLKARLDVEYASLQADYESACLDLAQSELDLANAKYHLEKNFD